MKTKFLKVLAWCVGFLMSTSAFAQGASQEQLVLGNYDTQDQSQAYDGFNLQNSPVVFAYAHSGSQVIYQPEQLVAMKGKQITSLSFKCFSNDCYDVYNSTMKIYLQEIDGNEFVKNAQGKMEWVKFNKENVLATTEFTGDFLSSYGEDIEVKFDLSQNPYVYNGKSLVVTIVNDAEASPTGTIQFYWVESKSSDPWRTLVFGSDDEDFHANQAKDNILNGNEDKWKNAPAVQFTYEESDQKPEPPAPAGGSLTLGNYDNANTNGAWDGFNLQNAPVIFTYGHSGSQVLYQAEQLAEMKNQQITSMTFKCFTEDCYVEDYTSTMTLYLHEVDEKEFVYDAVGEYYKWMDFDKSKAIATTQFTANFMEAYMNGTDIEVKFDLSENPYVYTGKTLVATVVNDAPECIDSSLGTIRFYWIDSKKGDPWSSAVYGSDDKDFLTNLSEDMAIKTTSNEDKWKNAPAVLFVYEPATVKPEPPAPSDFSGGLGTVDNPYLISKTADLDQLNEWTNTEKTAGLYFKLTQDLVEVPYTSVVGSEGNFLGHFDGGNHTIAVDINAPSAMYVGLFGAVVGGSVKNLHVTGHVVGNYYVGGVMGQAALGAEIENVINSCNVEGKYYVGGVIGQVVSMENNPSSLVSQCANYGSVKGKRAVGGIIGDAGQQTGNMIQRIANYGYIDSKKTAGGLIGNSRFYDQVYYGLNVGTSVDNSVLGSIGNSLSATIDYLFYDDQMLNHPTEYPLQMKNTSALLGNALVAEGGKGFSADYWLYADNMYPRLKMNGMENSPLAVLYATPVLLAEGNTLNSINQDFTVVTDNGVNWTSKNGLVEFDGNQAKLVKSGEDVLVASLDGYTKELKVTILVQTGIEEAQTAQHHIGVQSGAVVLDLSEAAAVCVMDLSGKLVAAGHYEAGHTVISLSSGIYVVKVNDEVHKVSVTK